jgi:hypothetical protein
VKYQRPSSSSAVPDWKAIGADHAGSGSNAANNAGMAARRERIDMRGCYRPCDHTPSNRPRAVAKL